MKTTAVSALVVLFLLCCGCAQSGGGGASRFFVVSLKSETTPNSKAYKTYILSGGGTTDFQSIQGQALERKVRAALASKGFIPASSPSGTDLTIFLFTGSEVTATPVTYNTPRTIWVPGTTQTSTTMTQLPGGYSVPSQTVTTTPGRTIDAGVDSRTFSRYGLSGMVSLSAGAWSEWVQPGAIAGSRPRVVWESKAQFFGDPPSTSDIAGKCLDWVLRNAGDDATFSKVYRGANLVIDDIPQGEQ